MAIDTMSRFKHPNLIRRVDIDHLDISYFEKCVTLTIPLFEHGSFDKYFIDFPNDENLKLNFIFKLIDVLKFLEENHVYVKMFGVNNIHVDENYQPHLLMCDTWTSYSYENDTPEDHQVGGIADVITYLYGADEDDANYSEPPRELMKGDETTLSELLSSNIFNGYKRVDGDVVGDYYDDSYSVENHYLVPPLVNYIVQIAYSLCEALEPGEIHFPIMYVKYMFLAVDLLYKVSRLLERNVSKSKHNFTIMLACCLTANNIEFLNRTENGDGILNLDFINSDEVISDAEDLNTFNQIFSETFGQKINITRGDFSVLKFPSLRN
jgi:hypothetical protein